MHGEGCNEKYAIERMNETIHVLTIRRHGFRQVLMAQFEYSIDVLQ
jgi:hypothetical protein